MGSVLPYVEISGVVVLLGFMLQPNLRASDRSIYSAIACLGALGVGS